MDTAITAMTVLTATATAMVAFSKGAAMIGVTAVTAAITVGAAGRVEPQLQGHSSLRSFASTPPGPPPASFFATETQSRHSLFLYHCLCVRGGEVSETVFTSMT